MINRIIILTLALCLSFLFSCSKDEIVISTLEFELFGDWIVTDYYNTNGPICYDIMINDTVKFVELKSNPNSFMLIYKLFEKEFQDTFSFNKTAKQIKAFGNYLHVDTNEIGPIFDFQPKQFLVVEKLAVDQIEFYWEIEIVDLLTHQLIPGDVSHFKARKIVQ